MYKPKFNQVLVEIDLSDAKWGNSNDSMLGESYSKGKLIGTSEYFSTADYPVGTSQIVPKLEEMLGKQIMWNEGHEAGKTFEHDGKLYALINWWDIVAVKDEEDGKQ